MVSDTLVREIPLRGEVSLLQTPSTITSVSTASFRVMVQVRVNRVPALGGSAGGSKVKMNSGVGTVHMPEERKKDNYYVHDGFQLSIHSHHSLGVGLQHVHDCRKPRGWAFTGDG